MTPDPGLEITGREGGGGGRGGGWMEEEEREGKEREKGERVGRITMHKQTHAPRQRRDPNPKTRTKSKQKGKGKKKEQYVKVGDNLSPALNAVVVAAVVVALELRETKSPVEGPIGAGSV